MSPNQKALDVIWEHAKRGDRSVNDDGKPTFHGVEGSRSFIGVLIADEHYQPWLSISPLGYCQRELHALALSGHEGVSWAFLVEAEYIHNHVGWMYWPRYLEDLSVRWGLRWPSGLS